MHSGAPWVAIQYDRGYATLAKAADDAQSTNVTSNDDRTDGLRNDSIRINANIRNRRQRRRRHLEEPADRRLRCCASLRDV
jgi:hypothetical protein